METLKFWKISQQLVYSQLPMCVISGALYLGIKKPAVSSGLENNFMKIDYSTLALIERFALPDGVMIVGFWKREFALTLR